MVQPAHEESLTAEQLFELPDRDFTELLDGRLVPMTPTGAVHGKVEVRLARLLDEFLEQAGAGWVLSGEVGVITRRNPDRVRGVDVALVSREQAAEIPEGFLTFPPELVAEVISPNDRWRDIQEKLDELFAAGVRQVWILDPKSRQILVYQSPTAASRYSVGERVSGTGGLTGLELEVARVFA